MKVWLNDLKEGDIFYHIILNNVCKCKHLGDAHNMNFKMSRIKFAIIENSNNFLVELGGQIHEAFVNQYVYDNYEEAEAQLNNDYKNELNDIKNKINFYKVRIKELESRETILKNEINNYEREYNKKN